MVNTRLAGGMVIPRAASGTCQSAHKRRQGARFRKVTMPLQETSGAQHAADDPRNDTILISVNGEIMARERAVVSVFDSGFVLGDGVWEGLRLVEGRIPFLDRHLDRL